AGTAGRWRGVAAAGLAVGVVAAGVFLAGEVFLRRALLDTSVTSYERGAALVPAWADVSRLGARIESFHGLHDPDHRQRALALARQATRRDPADPATWTYLGQLEMVWGSSDAAERALTRALDRNPWLGDALESRAVLAERQGDRPVREESCRRLDVLGRNPPVCRQAATVSS
ncbi:MAG: hypothetical protein M3Q48_13885, partial [Actinomycetota bacterium]|nr:hypothetical protein [Actinomycetota bacterium]